MVQWYSELCQLCQWFCALFICLIVIPLQHSCTKSWGHWDPRSTSYPLGHFAEWTFLRVGNRATSNKLVVAGHNLHHKSSKATATCHGHTISPRAAVCMPSFLWYALLPCPYLSNVSFQLSSVQGIALEQSGHGSFGKDSLWVTGQENIKSSRLMQPQRSEIYRVFICFYSTIFIHIIPYVQGCWYGPAPNNGPAIATTNAVGSWMFHPSPSSKRVPSPRGRAPACCSSDRCSSHRVTMTVRKT